jgi:hypothetical protein
LEQSLGKPVVGDDLLEFAGGKEFPHALAAGLPGHAGELSGTGTSGRLVICLWKPSSPDAHHFGERMVR